MGMNYIKIDKRTIIIRLLVKNVVYRCPKMSKYNSSRVITTRLNKRKYSVIFFEKIQWSNSERIISRLISFNDTKFLCLRRLSLDKIWSRLWDSEDNAVEDQQFTPSSYEEKPDPLSLRVY